MDVIDKLQGWLDALNQFDVWTSCCTFFKENEKPLVVMIQTQLSNCLDPYGNTIYGWQYPADLYNTGGFYRGMMIKTDDEKIEFTSTDTKWERYTPPQPNWSRSMTPLKDFFGEDVIGIPVEQEDMVSVAMADYVCDDFRKCFE